MTALAEKLSRDTLALSEADRASLVHRLIESLDGPAAPDVQPAWDAELARRLSQVEDGTAQGRPARTVLDEIRAQFR
jgi:putative addiction module component (TIGR02574 family)